MSVSQSVAGMLREHVTLEVESIDRLYLNVYVPKLQRVGGVVGFFREVRGATFASSALMEPLTTAFVKALERCAQTEGVPLLTFAQGQRKDEVAQEYLAAFSKQEGVLFIGKAQEKATVWHTERRYNAQTGQPYAWLVKSTALVNQYDIYAVDANFGPFFLKFCAYVPYNAKLCLNGHEYLKRQLVKEGIAFEALDNGILSCANPARLQEICDGLDAPRIDALLRVPLGCAEMMCFSRKTIGVAGRMGRLRPSAGLRTSRTALFWLTDKTCSEDLSSISAGPNGTVPITGLHAPTVIAGQSRRRVHAVPLAAVRAGSAVLGDHLLTACTRGATLLVVDATTDADLGAIVEAAGTALPAALLCGSAGLLGALALTTLAVQPMVNARIDEIDGVNGSDGAERVARRAACDGPVVIMVGSGSRRAHAQIASARARGVRTVEIGAEPVPDAADTLVLHLPKPADRALDGPIARQAATVLAKAALSAIDRLRPGLLLLVGGDTAMTVLTGLGVGHVTVFGELLPGMPLTYGLDAQGIARYVIVKAGNHGDAAVLETLLRITRAGP